MPRLFGRAAESDLDRERREIAETQRRRDRDAWSEARQRANTKEQERREATVAQNPGPRYWPGLEPEAVEARKEAARQRLEAAETATREAAAFRRVVADATSSARNAVEAAFAGRDLEAYVSARARHEGLRELLGRLDKDEAARRRIAGMPIIAGAERI